MSSLQKDTTGMVEAVQAADSGSFAAAARALNLTPAAVSKNVARLEARLHVRLFNRTTRHLSLTAEGRRFIAQVREGLGLLSEASAHAARDAQPEGLVRLSCGVSFGRRFVLPILLDFFAQYPQMRVELCLSDGRVDLVRDGFDLGIHGYLMRGGFDLGIRSAVAPPEGMVVRKVSTIHTVLVASPLYLRKSGFPLSWRDLERHKIIEVRSQSGAVWPWLFREGRRLFTLATPGTLILSEHATVVHAALHHLGIGQVTILHAWHQLQAGTLRRVLEHEYMSSKFDLAIYYPHRRGLAPRVRVVVDFLLKKLSQHPALRSGKRAN